MFGRGNQSSSTNNIVHRTNYTKQKQQQTQSPPSSQASLRQQVSSPKSSPFPKVASDMNLTADNSPRFNTSNGNTNMNGHYASFRGVNSSNHYTSPTHLNAGGGGNGNGLGVQVPPPRGLTAAANAQNAYNTPMGSNRGSPTTLNNSAPPAGQVPFQPPKPRTVSAANNNSQFTSPPSLSGSSIQTNHAPGGPNTGGGSPLGSGPAPIREETGLERLIATHNLLRRRRPIRELRRLPGTNTVKMGVDGNMLLRRVTQAIRRVDPMAMFTVTTPVTFYDELQAIVDEFEQLREAVAKLPRMEEPEDGAPVNGVGELSGGGYPSEGASGAAAVRSDGSPSSSSIPVANSTLNFQPVLVFDGIPLSPQLDPAHGPHPSTPHEMMSYTGATPVSQVPNHIRQVVAERFYLDSDLEQYFVRRCVTVFKKDVFRVPYYAWAQLSAFFSPTNRYISEVYGSIELLAYPGVDRVIVHVDPIDGTFDVVEKREVLDAVNAHLRSLTPPHKQYPPLTERDLGYWIMADTTRSPYRLSFLGPDSNEILLRLASSEVLPNGRGRGYAFAKGFTKDDNVEPTQLMQGNFSLLDAPVFTCEGKVEPLYVIYGISPYSSLRVARAFGTPLPTALYFCLFSGVVSPNLFTPVAQGILADRWPLIDSAAYRQALRSVLTLRVHSCLHVIQVASNLQPPSTWYRVFMQNRNPALQNEKWTDIHMPRYMELEEWDIVGEPWLLVAPQQYFLDVMKMVNRSVPYRDEEQMPIYTNIAETTASILLKTMDQLGYFTHFITTPPELPVESQLSMCSEALAFVTCNTLSEYALLMIEMLRTKTLNDMPIYITPTSTNMEAKYPIGVRFACRLLSLVPINVNGTWTGPFDPEMAAFGAISRLMARTLRELMEAITIATFCTRRTYMPLSDINDVLERLPFGLPIEFGAGHVMLYAMTHPEDGLVELENTFPECFSLRNDLMALFGFWHMAYKTIRTLQREVVFPDDVLTAADVLVRQTALRLDRVAFGFVSSNDF
ncbi:unnamed protein product [Phytomonas sp. EM1]|nr:unnamed protein product [Phytomonas sp. EM1]|eukprot:CCW63968.1 unnamed protein product [Phytomonas sp. isolate EM1]